MACHWIVQAVRVARLLFGLSWVESGGPDIIGQGSGQVEEFTARVGPLRGFASAQAGRKLQT